MNHESDILDRFSKNNAGMTVPDNFFENFNKKMAESLPEQPWEKESDFTPVVMPRSFWQKVRPYAYLAAMFMGIWCMMKMFDLMRSDSNTGLDNNPVLMSAIDNDAFYYDYCMSDMSDNDIYEELYEQQVDPAMLAADK